MRTYSVNQYKRGWFVGDFPCAYRTHAFELALKTYSAGETEAAHVHRVATELTLVTSGRVCMNGLEVGPGEVVVIEPGESCAFKALTDAQTVVAKTPSVPGDKYTILD